MPQLKARAGSSRSVRGCIEYLTRDGRALAADYINCSEIDGSGREVWRQMDDTRRLFGTDGPDIHSANGRMRSFEHFIISPDPRDRVDLPTLRSLATAWAERHFGDYEVAIYYHDDNSRGIPHAHIVVNNVNLTDGRRIAPKLAAGSYRRMDLDLQEMARRMGLRAFESTAAKAAGRKGGPIPATVQDVARTRGEQAIVDAGGYSWKEDIRQRMRCAVKLSRSAGEYLLSCMALGMEVRVGRSGEWVYALASHPTWQVSGRRIGFDFSRFGIERWLARDRALGRKIGAEAAERIRDAIASAIEAGGPAPSVLGMIDGERYTAKDVADMLDLCEDLDIRSMDDFRDASTGPIGADARERLRASWRLARSLGHLPEHRQRGDGERLGRRHGNLDADQLPRKEASARIVAAQSLCHADREER
ncbi:MAG: relaxase/mobilization nuclease domain-containing protein [Atopobiaceae bacterium]|nr:relaxase/mobilization nuclease domain-containing protein [Atopobiaceae bacterium]